MASDTCLFPLWNPLYLKFKLFMWDWYRWLDLFVPVSSGELLVRSLENVSYPCSLSVSEKLCMSSFIIINPKYHRNLRRFYYAENFLFLSSKYSLLWCDRKEKEYWPWILWLSSCYSQNSAFTASVHKSHAAAAGTLGLLFPMGASIGRSLQSSHSQKTIDVKW